MRKNTYFIAAALAGLLLAFTGFQSIQAQDAENTTAAEPTPDTEPATDAAGGTAPPSPAEPKTEEEVKAEWNNNLVWVSFIVDDGRVASQRDYFGAFEKAEFDAVIAGTKEGFVRVQQVFYYNAATRQFSRFDATQGGAVPILGKNGYFQPVSLMRIVPLNQDFVIRLARQNFLDVKGVEE